MYAHPRKMFRSWSTSDEVSGFVAAVLQSVLVGQVGAAPCGFQGAVFSFYNCCPLNRKALLITDTELKLIAALAIIGLKNQCSTGKNTPAAIGIPSRL